MMKTSGFVLLSIWLVFNTGEYCLAKPTGDIQEAIRQLEKEILIAPPTIYAESGKSLSLLIIDALGNIKMVKGPKAAEKELPKCEEIPDYKTMMKCKLIYTQYIPKDLTTEVLQLINLIRLWIPTVDEVDEFKQAQDKYEQYLARSVEAQDKYEQYLARSVEEVDEFKQAQDKYEQYLARRSMEHEQQEHEINEQSRTKRSMEQEQQEKDQEENKQSRTRRSMEQEKDEEGNGQSQTGRSMEQEEQEQEKDKDSRARRSPEQEKEQPEEDKKEQE